MCWRVSRECVGECVESVQGTSGAGKRVEVHAATSLLARSRASSCSEALTCSRPFALHIASRLSALQSRLFALQSRPLRFTNAVTPGPVARHTQNGSNAPLTTMAGHTAASSRSALLTCSSFTHLTLCKRGDFLRILVYLVIHMTLGRCPLSIFYSRGTLPSTLYKRGIFPVQTGTFAV